MSILSIMLTPFMTNAKTCDPDKISISGITVEEKSENVIETDEATANGKTINLNLSMSEIGDSIKYRVMVKNESSEDYEINNKSFNISSDYIDYKISSENNSSIIKANSTTTIYLKVEYKNEVPDEAFESGTYNDSKNVTVNLSTGNTSNVTKNPKTGIQLHTIILIIILITIATYMILKRKKYSQVLLLIIGLEVVIPISVYAICKCEITIDSDIKIEQKDYYLYYSSSDMIMPGDVVKYLKDDKYEVNEVLVPGLHKNYQNVLKPRSMMDDYDIYNFFIRYKISKGKISKIHMGYIIDNKDYYLEGLSPDSYQDNQRIMLESFGAENCNINDENEEYKTTRCYIPKNNNYTGLFITADNGGNIDAFDSISSVDYSAWSCMIYQHYTSCTIPD
ncbi:MAG: hypothetical protein IJI43_03860 [Bacilli bacterium]|nr:hypothetical protein [Bacilli bacterium]